MIVIDIGPTDEVSIRIKENDVRLSQVVEFLSDNRIAIRQTQPAMDHVSIMSLIFFTYCSAKHKNQRLGFQARVENITPDDRIIIRQLTTPFVCDLRLWPRVQFDVLPQLHAYCDEQEIQVVDISGGGTHLVLRENDDASPAAGALVEIKFSFESGETTADCKILRSWTDPEGLRHLEVKFMGQPEIRDFIYHKPHAA